MKTSKTAMWRVLGYLKPYWFTFGIGMLMYSAQLFLFPLVMATFQESVMNSILEADAQIMWDALIVLGVSVIIVMASIAIGIYVYVMASVKATKTLKRDLFRSFVNTGLEGSQSAHSGEGIAAINTEADMATEVYGNPMSNFLRCVIVIVGFSIVIFVTDWRMGVGALAIGLLAFVIQSRFTKPLARIGKDQLEANAAAVSATSNIFSGGLTIRAYNMQDRALISVDTHSGKLKFLDFKRATISAFQGLFRTVQGWLTLALIFGFGGYLVIQGTLNLANLMYLLGIVSIYVSSFGQIGQTYADLQPPIVAAGKVMARIDVSREQSVRNDNLKANGQAKPEGYEISINDFSFSYKDVEKQALQGISLSVAENKMVALVGESGSGKSTLLRAIIGMYERDEMPISVGGVAYNDVSTSAWRKNFAYVDQSCKLFDMSIGENIAMGAKGNGEIVIGNEELEKAAKRAFAHDFITEIEGGYDAPAGEKGASLSGGQKQRIAIARALIKGAPILVFDEATSALDKESEAYIMDTIYSLRNDHTILITSHNLNTIKNVDMIVVLDSGKIAEVGTHDELIDKNGIYKRLLEQNH
ncbi:MAG: ABC transporter ATP-binding protein/permease [Defluviitaleaceae bacterium]|nr:ABC transporter ATP-binding protein/permease [Defluviitaleaceae bacterium]